MKKRLEAFFPSDLSRSFDNAKKLSDYIGALARMVFIGPLTLLMLYWTVRTTPAVSLAYVSLLAVTLYFIVLSAVIFLSFSWLTAGYLHLIFFGDGRATKLGLVVTAAISLLIFAALAVILYEVAENSSIVQETLRVLDAMSLQ